MQLPLEDVKILDLTHALAGPFCSTMLADFGAQVIKLEPPGFGDLARGWGIPIKNGETSYFVGLHRNKRGIVVDLKKPEGKELFFKLVEKCDVVIENFRVDALKRLGLDYEEARKRNKGIIYCSISGFGQDGPYRERAALDLILQAESGMISVTGEPGTSGTRAGVSIADLTAGMYAAYGTMLALRVKDKTGEGQRIDISMLEGQLSLLGTSFFNYFANGKVPKPMGNAYAVVVPYQTFRTKTKDLAIAIAGEKLWRKFCPVIGRPELDRRSPLQDHHRPHEQSRHADPGAAGSVPDPQLRGVGEAAPRERHPHGRDQRHRPGRRASAGEGAEVAHHHGAPARGEDQRGSEPGASLRDTGSDKKSVPTPGPAHARGAAGGAGDDAGRDCGAGDGGSRCRAEIAGQGSGLTADA